MVDATKLKELSGSLIIYMGIPILLILAMKTGISEYNSISGLNIILPPWIHHGDQFLYGNIKGFLLTFPILILVAFGTRSLLKTAIGILIIWPLFSFVAQSLTGGYSFGSWGFSGHLYAFYGAIIYFMAIGVYNTKNNQYLKAVLLFIISLIVIIPLIFTPAILHINNITYYTAIKVHLLGFVFGLLIPATIQYPNFRSNRLWMLGALAIVMEWYQFLQIIPYL